MLVWFILAGCELSATPACPPGMVLVGGSGRLGLDPSAFAVVSTRDRAVVESPEEDCPAARASNPESLACWVQTDEIDPVLRERQVEVEPFCIDAFPFPGHGAEWTQDGMTAWDAQALDRLLSAGDYGGRRMCTMTEFQSAVAGLKSNRPFVYGGVHDIDRCPLEGRIGADAECSNPETGVHDYAAVRSHWVKADPAFIAAACEAPPCRGAGRRPLTEGHYIVAGGTARLQTRQAPLTPHTWHDHGVPNPAGCDDMGHDDQPVICADPHPDYGTLFGMSKKRRAAEQRWSQLVSVAKTTHSMTRVLETGLGTAVCPPAP